MLNWRLRETPFTLAENQGELELELDAQSDQNDAQP